MTPAELAESFVAPLLAGGEVTLGLPLSDAEFAALDTTTDAEVRAILGDALQRVVIQRARVIWARYPDTPLGVELLRDAALLHDLLLPLHSFAAKGLGRGYERRLFERVGERMRRTEGLWPPDQRRWLRRHVLADAALGLTRVDHYVEWKLLGRMQSYGRPLSWVRLPWRFVDHEGERTVYAEEAITPGLRDILDHFSPVTAAATRHPQTKLRALSPLLDHRPLARHLIRCLAHPEARAWLAQALAEQARVLRPERLRQWCGVALYLHLEAPAAAALEGRWASLVRELAPSAQLFGAPPIDPRAIPAPPAEEAEPAPDPANPLLDKPLPDDPYRTLRRLAGLPSTEQPTP